MSFEEKFKLTPIQKEEYQKLKPRLTIYNEIISKFLKSNDDIMELTLEAKRNPHSVYQSLKANLERHKYPCIVRIRERRIFLLKRRGKL